MILDIMDWGHNMACFVSRRAVAIVVGHCRRRRRRCRCRCRRCRRHRHRRCRCRRHCHHCHRRHRRRHAIVVVVFVVVARRAVAIIVDFVARRAVAIVVVVVAHRHSHRRCTVAHRAVARRTMECLCRAAAADARDDAMTTMTVVL
jgi:hypothetical protein